MPRSSAALLVTALCFAPAMAAPSDDAKQILADLQKELAVIDAKAQAEAKARKEKAAEALKAGQKGVVKVTLLPGRNAYKGSTRNSISSSSYEAFGGGYKVESALEVAGAERALDPLPAALSDLRGRNGTVYFFEITGRAD